METHWMAAVAHGGCGIPASGSESRSKDEEDNRYSYHGDCEKPEHAVRPLTLEPHDHLNNDEREPCCEDDSSRRHQKERRHQAKSPKHARDKPMLNRCHVRHACTAMSSISDTFDQARRQCRGNCSYNGRNKG
ncbi:MAG: hypothetical protein Q9197_002466 [Variospora fuerteventurae]